MMRSDFSALDNKPIRFRSVLAAIAVMAIGVHAVLQPDKPMAHTYVGAFLICVPSFLCLLRAVRKAYQLNIVASAHRMLAESDMQRVQSQVTRDFGSYDALRNGDVFKTF